MAGSSSRSTTATASWKSLAPMGTKRSAAGGLCVNEHQFLVMGGVGGSREYLASAEYYDRRTGVWRERLELQLPTPRAFFGTAQVGHRIYCLGGKETKQTESTRADLICMDLGKSGDLSTSLVNGWETLSPMHQARHRFACVADPRAGGSIYVFGGADAHGTGLDTVEKYEIATNRWTVLSQRIPGGARGGCAAALVGTQIYLVGGFDKRGTMSASTLVLDTRTDTWQQIQPVGKLQLSTVPAMRSARWAFSALAVDDRYVVAIGGDFDKSLEVLDTQRNVWFLSPSSMNHKRSIYAAGVFCMEKEGNESNRNRTHEIIVAGGLVGIQAEDGAEVISFETGILCSPRHKPEGHGTKAVAVVASASSSSNNSSKNSSISLLETVRQNGRWLGKPQTEEEHREKMDRILKHRSEFPTKLRPCIEEAKIRAQHTRAKHVLYSSLHEAATTTTATLSIPEMFEKILSKQAMVWIVGSSGEIGTLDKDVDTEDQVELVLRLFPVLLEQRLRIRQGSDYYRSVFFAMSSLRSISLVPVFVKVGWEWDSFWWEDNSFHRRGVFQNLLDNFIVRERFSRDPTVELEEESLVVLNRLWKEGALNQKDFYISSLLFAFLTNGCTTTTTDTADTADTADTTTNDSSRSIDFYERRLRLMIRWDPTILKHSATQHGPGGTLLCKLLTCHDHWKSDSLKFQAFKVALEEGMSTYPKELGFLFAQGTFVQACREFGIETMVELLHEQGKKLLAQTQISLQELVMEAATNDTMALEGLYFLIRSNPGSLFPTSIKNISRGE